MITGPAACMEHAAQGCCSSFRRLISLDALLLSALAFPARPFPGIAVCSDTSIIRSNVAETKLKMPDYREVRAAVWPAAWAAAP